MPRVYISENAFAEVIRYIESKGCEIIRVSKHADVQDAVAAHPDIYMCRLSAGRNSDIYFGDASLLSHEYPGDVLYNAACLGKYIICSKHTSQDLIKASGLEPIYVGQGYCKCNLVVVDETHVITEDEGIAKALSAYSEICCLLVSPHQTVLSGFPYGFIGGASGRVGDEIIFNGNIKAHSDYEAIKRFIESCGLAVRSFDGLPLSDIGSIISE